MLEDLPLVLKTFNPEMTYSTAGINNLVPLVRQLTDIYFFNTGTNLMEFIHCIYPIMFAIHY